MARSRVTLADVARRAGLSSAAASLILNDRPDTRLSADARERVLAAAKELGYRPNVAARGLRTDRTNTIGFISDEVAVTRYASGQIQGALRAAEEADHVVLVLETGNDRERESRAIQAVLDRQVDGIIFAAMRSREIELPPLPSATKVVLLNATNVRVASAVLPAEFEGGRTAVSAIAHAGFTDGIVLLGKNQRNEGDVMKSTNVAQRVAGARAEMAERGLAFAYEVPVESWNPSDSYDALTKAIKRNGQPKCILALNDPLAFGAYQALADAGLSIPGDVSIVGFDNDELAAYLRPGLTTVALPYEEMGAAAVRMLLSTEPASKTLIPMNLIVRGSL